MAHSTTLTGAIERLGYRVTVGDAAAGSGLPLEQTRPQLLALAADVQAHMQVSESGEIAYEFPRNLQGILRGKYRRLRWQALAQRVWGLVFYGIRISFGVLLILSLVLLVAALAFIVIALSAAGRQDDDRDGGFGGGMIFFPRFWFGPNPFYLFDFDYGRRRRPPRHGSRSSDLNFLEAVFSFLFGDGDPNADLEERRWRTIAQVIRNHQGAVTAEQIAPYLDTTGEGWSQEFEDFMLPVLSRFNGEPQVSPDGGIIYCFPELQVMARSRETRSRVPAFLQELPYRFSQASSTQIMWAIGLGAANLIAALALGSFLQDPTSLQAVALYMGEAAQGVVALAAALQGVLLAYGVAFLGVPLVRYFWIQRRNGKIEQRNQERQSRTRLLQSPTSEVQQKLEFARQFAAQTVVDESDLAYTTETDLIDQEIASRDKIDEEWQRRLRERNPGR